MRLQGPWQTFQIVTHRRRAGQGADNEEVHSFARSAAAFKAAVPLNTFRSGGSDEKECVPIIEEEEALATFSPKLNPRRTGKERELEGANIQRSAWDLLSCVGTKKRERYIYMYIEREIGRERERSQPNAPHAVPNQCLKLLKKQQEEVENETLCPWKLGVLLLPGQRSGRLKESNPSKRGLLGWKKR